MTTDLALRFRIGFALIGLVLLAGASVVAIHAGNGAFGDGYRLTATFDTATQGLDLDSEVKIRGVTVGAVDGIELLDNGDVLLKLTIQEGVEVADTTVASIEPLSIFGPKFVRLEPGEHETTGPFLAKDDEIAETVPPVEFTEVLGDATRLLQAIDTDELATIFQTLGDGLAGLGGDLGSTVDDGAVLADLAARHIPDTQQFLADLALLSGTFADRGDELVATATALHEFLPELSEGEDELGALLDSTALLSGQLADLISAHQPDIDATIRGLAGIVNVAYAQLHGIPDLFESLNSFFGTLGEIIRLPHAPSGTIIGALRGPAGSALCELIIGLICPVPPSPYSTRGSGG